MMTIKSAPVTGPQETFTPHPGAQTRALKTGLPSVALADFSAAIFPFFLAARNVAECPEYRHVVPGHPPFCDLSAFDAEHCPEIKLRLATRRWKRSHWPLLCALIRGPCSNKIPLGDQKLDRLDRIRKDCRILPQKFLDLIETTSLDPRRCFAMADNIRCDEVVERVRLTAVPCVEETPNYGLVLLCRCAHGEALSIRRAPGRAVTGSPKSSGSLRDAVPMALDGGASLPGSSARGGISRRSLRRNPCSRTRRPNALAGRRHHRISRG